MAEAKLEAVELGEFQVHGLDVAGGEVRLSQESSGSNFVIRKNKALAKEMLHGRTGILTFTPLAAADDPGRVVVEVPADEVEGMSSNAKIIEDAGTRKKANK